MNIRQTILFCVMLLSLGNLCFGQMRGRVCDTSGKALEYVNVSWLNSSRKVMYETVTDTVGHFALPIVKSGGTLRASLLGYKTVSLPVDITTDSLQIVMEAEVQNLKEVTVTASSIIQKSDKKIAFPLQIQLAHATNGLELLDRMMLPGLTVDLQGQSINSILTNGKVQLRINDVPAEVADVLAIEASRIANVEIIDMPGVRYGKSVGCVVNVVLKKVHPSVAGGINLSNALLDLYGNDMAWLRVSDGKSEWGIKYSFDYTGYHDYVSRSEQKLQMTAQDVLNIDRTGTMDGYRKRGNNLALTYNRMNGEKGYLHLLLSLQTDNTPTHHLNEQVAETGFNLDRYTTSTTIKDRLVSPTLQLNYVRKLDKQQVITSYLSGNYIYSQYNRAYLSGDYTSAYGVNGDKYLLYNETNYEKEWADELSLLGGYRYTFSHTANSYAGSTGDVDLRMLNHDLELYSQLRGKLKRLNFALGVTYSGQYFKEADRNYFYQSLMPGLTLSYAIKGGWNVRYQYAGIPILPQLHELSEVEQWQTEREVVRGNALLKPWRSHQNQLTLQYNDKNFFCSAMFYYQHGNHGINDNSVERVGEGEDAVFLYTKSNDSKYEHLQGRIYARCSLLKNRLSLSAMAGINRHIVSASTYSHTLTSFFYHGAANVYLGKWQIGAKYMSTVRSVMNETFNKSFPTADFHISYKHKQLLVTAGVTNPLLSDGNREDHENRSLMAYKFTSTRMKDFGNMPYIRVSWTFSKGKQHASEQVELRKADYDTGIVK